MSRLQELADQIKNQVIQLADKIKETELYNKLKDKYESLTPSGQKVVQILSVIIIVGMVIYVPLSQVQTSSEQIANFENHRGLIRELFKTYRVSSAHLQIPPAPGGAVLVSQIQSTLQNARLLPEQIVNVIPSQSEGRLIPQTLLSDVVEVNLIKLNLKQIVDIGTQLTNLSPALKLKDMVIKANSELAGYFDVKYKIYALKVPEPLPEPAPEPITTKKNKNSGKKDKADKEDE